MIDGRSAKLLLALAGALVPTVVGAVEAQDRSAAIYELRRHFMEPSVNALTFHTIDSIFETQSVAHGAASSNLPRAERPLAFTYQYRGQTIPAEDALERTFTNALIIIKDGRIVAERYRNFTTPATRFLSMSLAKSVTSILIGIAVDDRSIRSLDDQITAYVPELKGSAYDGVTIRDAIDMKTGVDRADADQLRPGSPASDTREQIMVRNARPAISEALDVRRKAQPGQAFEYSTLNATVLGWVLERATKQPIATFMSNRLWKPMGAEADGYWMVDGPSPSARPLTGMGFNATLRDYARIGAMMLAGGRANGRQIVSAKWVAESTGGEHRPTTPGAPRGYQHMWWTVPGESAFMGLGLQGQYIFVDPRTLTVIVKMSYYPLANRDVSEEAMSFLRAASAWDGK